MVSGALSYSTVTVMNRSMNDDVPFGKSSEINKYTVQCFYKIICELYRQNMKQ